MIKLRKYQRGNLQFPVGMYAILNQLVDPAFTSDPYFIVDAAGGPPAEAELQLLSTGNVRSIRLNLPDTTIGTWDNGQGGVLTISDYDFLMATTSGSLNSPGSQLADTWITGFSSMYWGVREDGAGITNFTGTLRMRPTGGGADIDTASVSLQAETV